MELIDARKLSQDAQEALRLRIIKIVSEDGKTRTEVADLLGVSRYAVNCWVTKFQQGGKGTVSRKKRWRRSQDMTKLHPHQCATIVSIIHDRCPD